MIVPTPIVLIPALACTPTLYEAQISALWKFGPVMIADHTKHDSVSEIARGILESAPPRFALAGLSLGGYVAFEILRQAPERVLKLALMSTTARPDTPEQTQARNNQITIAQAGGYSKIIYSSLPSLLYHSNNETLRQKILKMAEDTGPDAYIRQQQANKNRPDSRPLLPSVQCPTLVLAGQNDKLTPPDRLKEIASGIRGSRYIELPDCGHAATLDQPELTTQALVEWAR